ncbi:MAG: putative signal transducing protein [Verrucomicrobiota bacterium]
MKSHPSEFTPILSTGKMLCFDWACGALEDAGIPYQCREESSGGLQVAMPAFPSVMPGTWWTVLVPSSQGPEAQEILASMPFDHGTTPDVWDYQPKPSGKRVWQSCAILLLALILAGIVSEFLRHAR